ncbi:hypothetical protein [Streptomyces sp. NPDC057280]|uniref:hypothetical protein n=1 Tax=Streptomyces sp. NPDC057280 TaxID=3346081 RepID=UPI0036416548
MSDHGTVTRKDRVTVPSPGCLIAITAPILVVLIVASVLMLMYSRQESANDRNEKEAQRKTVSQAQSYAHDVAAKSKDAYPGQEAATTIAEQHDGRLISYTPSGSSLATTVRFFAEYKDTSMFGVSYSRAHRCYSIQFRKNANGDLQETTTPLEIEKCVDS